MNFLLETINIDPMIYVLLAVGAVLAIAFHIRTKNSSKSTQNDEIVAEDVGTATANTVQSTADEEIVAVIAAAIAMAESENSGLKFKVVSFRRI